MTQICNSCLKNIKFLYTKHIINNINIDEIDHIFGKYIDIHKQKFIFFYIDCQFEMEFKNIISASIEINYHYSTDYINIKSYLLFHIDSCGYGNFIFR